jgi:hypothetical protein
VHVEVVATHRLWFGPDDPVRAASAVTAIAGGWFVVQDDANHAAWWDATSGRIDRVRLFPPVEGLDVFGDADGTKHRKPDLEAACTVTTADGDVVVALGSGSLPARTRGVLVEVGPEDTLAAVAAELAPLYGRVAAALGIDVARLNLEGACLVGGQLRWFQRGHGGLGIASASVDVPCAALVAALRGQHDPASIEPAAVRRYDLGVLEGLALAITDAEVLDDGRVVVAATAEDAPDAIADGPVVGSVLGLLTDDQVQVVPLPPDVARCKVEGLASMGTSAGGQRMLAVVDDDDPTVASLAFELLLREPTVGGAG